MGPAARRHLQREGALLQQHEEFPCKSTKTLNNAVATKYMPHARSAGTLSKTDSWVQKFFVFAQKICRESGQPRSDLQCLASNNMCRHFITHTAEEDKGFSRARSARTVLSMERKRRGLPELTEDMQIAAVVNGVETANPRTKKQSAGLTATMVKFIRKVWGKSRSWWKRQNAAMLTLGFVSIMRLGELVSLKRSRIHIVLKDGSEVELHKLKAWPARSMIVGMLLHLPWRKNHPGVDCWIPVACPITIDLILQQVSTLRSMRSRSDYLFPSRAGKRINKTNHINQQSARGALQHACAPHVKALGEDVHRARTKGGRLKPYAKDRSRERRSPQNGGLDVASRRAGVHGDVHERAV